VPKDATLFWARWRDIFRRRFNVLGRFFYNVWLGQGNLLRWVNCLRFVVSMYPLCELHLEKMKLKA